MSFIQILLLASSNGVPSAIMALTQRSAMPMAACGNFFFLKLSEVEVNDWLKVMNSHQNLGILRSVNNYGNSPYFNGRYKLPIDSYGPEVLPLLPITLKMP
jgi:hypothetical protein